MNERNITMTKALLVMTVGQTDVQIVVNEERHKLDGNACGTLHDAIKARSWSVVDAPDRRSRDLIKEEKDLPAGNLHVCTPKLDAVLAHFEDVAPLLPTSVLILETRRQDARDPRFAGAVMERRLRDRGVEDVTRVAFLTGDEQLEDPSNKVDAVVRRAVVATLSDAIGLATAGLTPDDLVFVATTGGLAAANELVNELVRLHCVGGPRVTALEVPDGNRAGQADRAVEEMFHPAAGYSARWHALSLVEKGNLLGAWGAVSHLEGAPGQEWTQVVKCLAHFASSLPMPEPMPENCDLGVLTHDRMAVRAALRVELALRAGDIPRAVQGTVAFSEAALWDHLGERVQRHETKSNKVRFRDPPPGELIRELDCANLAELSKTKLDDNKRRPFVSEREPNEASWYTVDDSRLCAIKIAKDYLKLEGLTKLAQAAATNAYDLRNDVAHNEPTLELMSKAGTRMQKAALWSNTNTNTFLSQPLVQSVLTELHVAEPASLLTNLLGVVRKRLVNPDSRSAAEP